MQRILLKLAFLLAAMAYSSTISFAHNHQPPHKDCDNAAGQIGMNICAGDSYREVEEHLNKMLESEYTGLDTSDEFFDLRQITVKQALKEAQTAWEDYQFSTCIVEGSIYGGSMESLIYWTCSERIARQRIDELYYMHPNNKKLD